MRGSRGEPCLRMFEREMADKRNNDQTSGHFLFPLEASKYFLCCMYSHISNIRYRMLHVEIDIVCSLVISLTSCQRSNSIFYFTFFFGNFFQNVFLRLIFNERLSIFCRRSEITFCYQLHEERRLSFFLPFFFFFSRILSKVRWCRFFFLSTATTIHPYQ